MLKHFFVLFLFSQSFADDLILPPRWCSSNALESLLKCLLDDQYSNKGWFMKFGLRPSLFLVLV